MATTKDSYKPQNVPRESADPQLRSWLDTEHRRLALALRNVAYKDVDETITGTWTFDAPVFITDDSNSPLTINGTVNGSYTAIVDNDSNGTANAARVAVASGDVQVALFAAGSGRTSTVLTGGPTGAQSVLRNLGNYPMIFGINNIARVSMDATAMLLTADNYELRFGTGGDDLAIYHDGTNNLYDSNTGTNIMRSSASVAFRVQKLDGTGLLSLATAAPSLTIGDGVNPTNPNLDLNGPAATNRDVRFETNGVLRWAFRVNSTAEGGANTGSDMTLLSRDDAGAAIATSVIERATMQMQWSANGTSAALPRYSFAGDTDTGIERTAANTMDLCTGGISVAQAANALSFVQSKNMREVGTISPAQLTVATDNYNPTGLSTAGILRLSTNAALNLTGIVAQPDGTRILLCNVGTNNLVLVHDLTSTAANRFFCPGSVNYTLNTNDSVYIWYDQASTRWRVCAAA